MLAVAVGSNYGTGSGIMISSVSDSVVILCSIEQTFELQCRRYSVAVHHWSILVEVAVTRVTTLCNNRCCYRLFCRTGILYTASYSERRLCACLSRFPVHLCLPHHGVP